MAYRWVGAHAFRDHANDRVIEPGERLPEDVAEQIAAAHPHDVEAIDDSEAEDTDSAPDVDEWADWNEDDWLDVGYEQRADDVRAGRVDEHLEAIADVETSSTVEGAVEARRNELADEQSG
jgi:hypothetical protein